MPASRAGTPASAAIVTETNEIAIPTPIRMNDGSRSVT